MAPAKSMIETLLDKGEELREEYSENLRQRDANRKVLRDLEIQGMLTESESDRLLELYPPREKKTDDADDAEFEQDGE